MKNESTNILVHMKDNDLKIKVGINLKKIRKDLVFLV